MAWRSVPLNEDTIITFLAAIKTYKLDIEVEDEKNLLSALQMITDERVLENNSKKLIF